MFAFVCVCLEMDEGARSSSSAQVIVASGGITLMPEPSVQVPRTDFKTKIFKTLMNVGFIQILKKLRNFNIFFSFHISRVFVLLIFQPT